MTLLENISEEEINREIITISGLIGQIYTETDRNLNRRAYTYVLNKNKLQEADAIVLTLIAKIKELTSK